MHTSARIPVFESLRLLVRCSCGYLSIVAFAVALVGLTANATPALSSGAGCAASAQAILQGAGGGELTLPADATLRLEQWQVMAGTVVTLHQPTDGSQLTLVVDGTDPVEIAGTVRTNGRLVIVSRAGFKVAPAASIEAAAVSLHQPADAAVRSEVLGSVRAHDIQIHAGKNGTLRVGGNLDATSLTAKGGSIRATGKLITVANGARIDASGALGGGEVFVGGGFQGQDAMLLNADRTIIEQDVTLTANATTAGDGGRIIVWSDYDTSFHGLAVARGGERSGNGGFVEVSGKGVLAYRGLADLRSRAPLGQNGTLLLDPTSITIQAVSPDIDGANSPATADIAAVTDLNNATTRHPGAASVITAAALNALLTGTASVTLAATEGITITAGVVGAGTSSLTLNAGTTITLTSPVNVPTVTLIHGGALTGAGLVTATTLNLQGAGSVGGSGASLNTNVGTLVLNKSAGATFINETDALAIQGTTGGDLTVVTAGAITQTAPLAVTGISSFTAGGNAITLTQANTLTGAVALNNSGANNVAVTTTGALTLDAVNVGTGTLTLTGVGVSQFGAATITQTAGAGAVAIQGGAGVIGLGNNNTFTGAVSLSNSGSNAATIVNTGPLTLGNCVVGGALTLTSGGPLVSGRLTVFGATTLTITAAGSDVTLSGDNYLVGAVSFAGATDNIRDLNLRNVYSGAVSPTLAGLSSLRHLTLSFADAPIALPAVNLPTGNLTVTAAGAITQSGALTVAGTASFTTRSYLIDLSQANSFGGTVTLTNTGANNVTIVNGGALTLGAVSVPTGTLNVTASTGGIVQAGGTAITSKTAKFTANGGGDVTLANTTNAFGTVGFVANNVSVVNSTMLDLGESTIAGSLTVDAKYRITQTGAVTVTGATNLKANGGPITLTKSGNNFAGGLAMTSVSTATIAVSSAVDLLASTISGNYTLTAGGSVTNSGALAVGGNLSITSAGAISVNAATTVTGSLTLNVNSPTDYVVSNPTGPVSLPAMSVTTLTVVAGGAVTQRGPVTVTGAANIKTLSNAGGAITLTNEGNAFGSIVAQARNAADTADTAAAIDIRQGASNMVLAGVRTGGTLNLVTSGGAITQTGTLVVGGDTTVSAGAGAITITDNANTFGGRVALANTGAANVGLSSATAITLGNVSVGTGSLTVNANVGGASPAGLTQVAGTTIVQGVGAGAVTFSAGAGVITLANTGNSLTGAVSLTTSGAGNNVALTNGGALTLGTCTVGDNLTLSTTGAIGQAAETAITVPSLFSITATSGNVVVANSGNYLNRVAITAPANASVRDVDGVTLMASTVAGNLTAVSGGVLNQGGALSVTGTASFKTLSNVGTAITLNDNANVFGKVIAQVRDAGDAADTNANVTINGTGTNGIAMEGVRTLGDLTIVSNNTAISQTGPVIVGGTATFTSGTAGLVLDGENNDLRQVNIVTAALAKLRDINDLIVSGTVSGAVTITAPGTVTTTGLTAGSIAFGINNQTITFAALGNRTFGDAPFTVPATASSGLPVTFSIVSGPATIAGNTVTLTGAGTVVVRASQAGNATYGAAPSVDQSFTVLPAASTITFAALGNRTFGDAPFTVSATASSGLPVTFTLVSGPATIAGNTVTLTDAGTVVVRASQAGNANYTAASSVDQSFTVLPAASTITFAALNRRTFGDAPFTVSATASSGLPVTFSIVGGPATIAGNTVTLTGTGTVVVRASQAGNATYSAAPSVEQAFSVLPLASTITFAALGNRTMSDSPFTVSATASSGLPVTFSIVSGPATIAGNTITLTGTGTVVVRASQAGNANYTAATVVDRSFTVLTSGTPGIYFGNFGGSDATGRFGFQVSSSNSGVFLAYLAGSNIGLFTQNFPIDNFGRFIVTFDGVAPATSLPDALAAPRSVTLQGTVVGGTITGTISQLGLSFAGNVTPATGTTQASVGLYRTAQIGSPAGATYALVAANGQAYVYSTNGQTATGSAGAVSAAGVVTAALPDQSQVALTVNAAAGTATGTITTAGGISTKLVGVADTVANTSRLFNVSSRSRTNNNGDIDTLISGFAISGSVPKRMLIRVVGPGLAPILAPYGITSGWVTDPSLQVFSGTTAVLSNNNWGTGGSDLPGFMAQAGAFPLSAGSTDAALVATLAPGRYTVLALGGTGMVLTEVYELLEAGETPGARRMSNISIRGPVGTGNDILIAGVNIQGSMPKKVLIRAAGPGLVKIGVPVASALANPRLRLYSGSTLVKENDDWYSSADVALIGAAATGIGAFAFDATSPDAAILVTLEPGSYTAQVDGVGNTTGVALIEVYEVP